VQATVLDEALPYPPPSVSAKYVLPTPSFTCPSQSSSAVLQISVAAGLMLALPSLQSVLLVT
jgi:hypothetical protein